MVFNFQFSIRKKSNDYSLDFFFGLRPLLRRASAIIHCN